MPSPLENELNVPVSEPFSSLVVCQVFFHGSVTCMKLDPAYGSAVNLDTGALVNFNAGDPVVPVAAKLVTAV